MASPLAPENQLVHCPACAVSVHVNCHAQVDVACQCLCATAIRARVGRGIRLLTSRRAPQRCLDTVDLDRLDMASLTLDVAGQIWGYDLDGYSALGLTETEAAAFGLAAYVDDYTAPEYRLLTACWVQSIRAMRAREATAERAVA